MKPLDLQALLTFGPVPDSQGDTGRMALSPDQKRSSQEINSDCLETLSPPRASPRARLLTLLFSKMAIFFSLLFPALPNVLSSLHRRNISLAE